MDQNNRNLKKGIALAFLVAATTLATGCSKQQQQPYPQPYPPVGGGWTPGQVPGKIPDLPPISQFPNPGQQFPGPGQFPIPGQIPGQLPPTPGKLDPGQFNPGQFNPGQFGQIPFAPGAIPGVPGQPGVATQPGAPVFPGAPGSLGTPQTPGQPGVAGPVFQPAAPLAPGSTPGGVPTAPGATPIAGGSPAAPAAPQMRFTNETLAQLQTSLAGVKGSNFEAQMTQLVGNQQYQPGQKYTALAALAAQVAGRVQADGSQNVAQLQAYVKQFSPDQGEAVAKVLADVNGMSEAQIKTDLIALHGKITTEMNNQLALHMQQMATAAAAAAQPAAQPVANPSVTPPPALTGGQQAPAPQLINSLPAAPRGEVQMMYIQMDS